jgi:hypothetical protein
MGTLSWPLYFDNQHFARAAMALFGKQIIITNIYLTLSLFVMVGYIVHPKEV